MPTVAHSPITSKSLPNTAATAHYLHPNALPHCSHVAHTTSGPTFQVANKNIIKPAFSSTLQLSSKLSSRAQSAHFFNEITTGSLISMRQICENDCVAIFTKSDVKILKHNRVIITGLRDHTNGLWNIPLGTSPPLPTTTKALPPKPSKRHYLPRHYQTRTFPILSHCSLQPCQVQLHCGHQQRPLQFVARPVCEPHIQTSSPVSLHHEGPP